MPHPENRGSIGAHGEGVEAGNAVLKPWDSESSLLSWREIP